MRIILAVLVLLAPLAAAEPLHVNAVTARSVGCSPDFFTSPDLRVRVFVDGTLVLETSEASDAQEPLFAALARADARLPAVVGIEVEEGEPGGFFGLGATRWVQCDAAPGPDRRLNVTVDGETRRIVARGDEADAAEAVVVVGRDAPDAPTLRVLEASATEARVAWAGDARATAHRLARGGTGSVLTVAGPGDATATLTGLCDNHAYVLRLVRDRDPWSVASPDVTLTTPNAPPAPARILSTEAHGRALNLSWESRTTHDVAAFEVHAGASPTFQPEAASLRSSEPPSFVQPFAAEGIPLQAGDAYVRIRTVDAGGLTAVSDALGLGMQQPPLGGDPPDCARPADVTVSGGGTPAPATHADPAPATRGDPTGPAPAAPLVPWPILLAVALGAAAVGGVLVLALRR